MNMILYDKDGNKYLTKGATLVTEIDEKEHYEKMFYKKIKLYREFYVEAIGDVWSDKCIYKVAHVKNERVGFYIRVPSGSLYTKKCIYFQTSDLNGSNDDFIKTLNKRAFAVLLKLKSRKRESLRLVNLTINRELDHINNLIKKTGVVAYQKK